MSFENRRMATRTVMCVECHCSSGLYWRHWGAYRIDEPDTGEPPALAFYCPTCAEREFGIRRRTHDEAEEA